MNRLLAPVCMSCTLLLAACSTPRAVTPAPAADVSTDALPTDVTALGDDVTLTSAEATLTVRPKALALDLRFGGALRTSVDLGRLRLGQVATFDPNWNYNPSNLKDSPPEDLQWLHVASAENVPSPEPQGTTLLLHTATDVGLAGPNYRLVIKALDLGRFSCELEASDDALRAALQADTASPAVVLTGLRLAVDKAERFYGLGEFFDTPQHRGKLRPMQIEVDFNIDSSYNEAHVAVPLLIGTNGWGLFVESRRPALFDVAASRDDEVEALFDAPSLRFYLLAAAKPLEITNLYTRLTGAPVLPARWAFGSLIWRNENKDQAEVISDMQEIRKQDLAISGMWLDRPFDTFVNNFGFDPAKFSDPAKMIAAVHALGMRVGEWSTPYVEKGATHHDEVVQKGWLVKTPSDDSKIFKWGPPLDLTNPEVLAFWKGQIQLAADAGIEGWKMDYGEDIQVGIMSARMHFSFHDGSDERTMHHGYAPFYHRPYAESLPKDGGFLLCRGGTYGDQIYTSIIWPGDLCANWTHFKECDAKGVCHTGGLPAGVAAAISLPTAGYPLFGADTGGYKHGRAPKELFLRWLGHTALSGILQIGGGDQHNPWDFAKYGDSQFDQETLDAARELIRLHTRLFPYLYTAAQEAHEFKGIGPVRAIGLVHPELGADPRLQAHEADEYYLGDALLVAPITEPGGKREVFLPPGFWIDWWSHEAVGSPILPTLLTVDAPLGQVPLYVKAPTLLPLLRPTIDTLAPATEGGVDSFANDVGRLHVIVPMWTSLPATRTLYDGSVLSSVGDGMGLSMTLSLKAGSEFKKGVTFEVWLAAKPISVKDHSEVADDAALQACTASCWRWDEASRVAHVRPAVGVDSATLTVEPDD